MENLDLEIRVCYLEDYINQMNKILINQGKKIDKLIEINSNLKEKLSILEENIKTPIENTPPPHY